MGSAGTVGSGRRGVTAPENLRLFFALWPDDEVRRAVTRATKALVRRAGGRPVPMANLHITLAFLGSVPATELASLKSVAEFTEAVSFELLLDRPGFFPRARSLWLGLTEPCPALMALEHELWAGLTAAGWSREQRPFHPHLSLARKARDVTEGATVKPVVWSVTAFSLIQSVTHQSGPVYQELARWPLTTAS